jgi:hypothetical protein
MYIRHTLLALDRFRQFVMALVVAKLLLRTVQPLMNLE